MRRYFGWNKTVALGIGGSLALLKSSLCATPSGEVSHDAIIFIERFNALAIVCFGREFLAPAEALLGRLPKTRARLRRAGTTALVFCVIASVLAITPDVFDGGSIGYVGWSVWSALTAFFPLAALEAREWLRVQGWYRRVFLAGEGASAGMASVRELRRRFFPPRRKEGTYGYNPGLLLGWTTVESTFRPFPIRLYDELGTLVVGAARSGKSVRFLWTWVRTNDQINIVVDPKAHAARLTSGSLSDPEAAQRFGPLAADPVGITRAKERLPLGRVHIWDPYGLASPYRSVSINVVLLVDPSSPYGRIMLAAISQSIVIPTGDEQHWVAELTRLVIEGFVAHLRTRRPPDQQSLGYLADLFAGLDRAEGDVRLRDDFHPIETLLAEMRTNDAMGGVCMQAAQAFASLEGREVGIVVSEIARSLKTFTDPVIRAATSGPGVDLRAVVESTTPVTLFLSLPFAALVEHTRVLRVVVSCLLRLTEHRRDKSRAVHFFLDEFAAYAKNLTAVRDATVTLGGAGARLHIALQFIGQLAMCVGRDAAAAFEASSNLVVSGVGDRETADYVSQRFGTHTLQKLSGWWPFRRVVSEREVPVLDTATVGRLLDRKSRLGACVPGVGAPFVFETLAFKPMRLHGTPMNAWALPEDAFDEHLLAEERGERPPATTPTVRLQRPTPRPPRQLTLHPQPPRLRLQQRRR